MEPIAAALGRDFEEEGVYWLVYDLGGGTFDAAVIDYADGRVRIVNHAGDNNLGGKLIDWDIVHKILVPALRAQAAVSGLDDSERSLPIRKLKWAAENAKMELSRVGSALVDVENLCEDDRGRPVDFEYELSLAEVTALAEPYFARTVNLCRQALTETNLGPADISRVILVGGQTLSPDLRDYLLDPSVGLGIELDFSVDPLTAVAQGAARFAAHELLPAVHVPKRGGAVVELAYQPAGFDRRPTIGGRVTAEGLDLTGVTIEFVAPDAQPPWRSGRIPLGAGGTFMIEVFASAPGKNRFEIALLDAQGATISATPREFTYLVDVDIAPPILPSTFGVATANNEVAVLLEKGSPLPARKQITLRTALAVRAGAAEVLRAPLVYGESIRRADRNRVVGSITISGEKVPRDLPEGTPVEIQVEVDADRHVVVSWEIRLIDTEFEPAKLTLGWEKVDPESLADDVELERTRLRELRERARAQPEAFELMRHRVDGEQLEQQLAKRVVEARTSESAAQDGEELLRRLQLVLDDIEELLEWPSQVQKSRDAAAAVTELLAWVDDSLGSRMAQDRRRQIEHQAEAAIVAHDSDALQQRTDELWALYFQVIFDHPNLLIALLEQLRQQQHLMTDQASAAQLLRQADDAIACGNLDSLKAAAGKLMGLLPRGTESPIDVSGLKT
jgi:molecular chaperone DnaK